MKTKRWQDWCTLLLGAWLFVSPWAMKYAGELPKAAWNAYIIGGAIVLFAAVAVYIPKVWEEWLNAALGIWTAISPWVLGFASTRNVTTNAVVVGVLVAVLAIWAAIRDQDFQRWWHSHHRAA